MELHILDRDNVTSLLDTNTLMETLWLNCGKPSKMMGLINDFYQKYPYCEILIQEDEESLGIIVDAYSGEDNMDSIALWYQDFN